MKQTDQFICSPFRNSYTCHQLPAARTNQTLKTFQYNSPLQQQSKVINSIRSIQTRFDGVQATVNLKKNSVNEENSKSLLNGQANAFHFYEPVRFSASFNNNLNNNNNSHAYLSINNDERTNELRGSCPNIFKKLENTTPTLRSTTQFVNMGKRGFNNTNYNESTRKQRMCDEAQTGISRNMKKTQTNYFNSGQQITAVQNVNQVKPQVFFTTKVQTFNPCKSLSNGQLPSFLHNFTTTLNKSKIKKQKKQTEVTSPSTIEQNRTPNKLAKPFLQFQKKTTQNVLKSNKKILGTPNLLSSSTTSGFKTNQKEVEQKKFQSLHQIWETKEKEKTLRKISQGIKNNNLQKSKIINGFELGKVLGKGKFGQVFLARHQKTGFIVAIKKIVKSKVKQYKMIDQFSKQIKLHNALDHPNIVKFFGFFQQGDDIYLIIEYIDGGTLFDYLNEVYQIGVRQTIEFLRDIIEAIVYLHDKSIAHRDIKPQNIVISTEGVAKLCDFGWSAVIETSRKTYCGTFDYAPPEILERKNYDMSVDVWCIGVLTYELLTGRVPFEGEKRNQIMEKIVNVDKNKITYPVEIPKQAKDFIELLVQKDPNLRPKPSELLKHPFFQLCPLRVKSKKLQ